jgi:nucleotide-binding universal stress UspA family protein
VPKAPAGSPTPAPEEAATEDDPEEPHVSARELTSNPRIVAGVDGSPSSVSALRWAIRQAGLSGSSVDAVIAWHQPAAAAGFGWAPADVDQDFSFEELAGKTLTEAISDTHDPAGDVGVRALVMEGNPAQVLLAAAASADLLVVGSRGHGGFAEALLGSVSQHCVHQATCPVVVIRGDTALTGNGGSNRTAPVTAPPGA